MPGYGTIIGMPISSDTPPWLQTPRLKLSLTDAQTTLKRFIAAGHSLWAEVPQAADAEAFTRRVNEWRRHASQWLEKKIGGEVADEYQGRCLIRDESRLEQVLLGSLLRRTKKGP